MERLRIAQGQDGKTLLVELEDGKVGLEVSSNDHRAQDPARRLQDRTRPGRSGGEARERDLDAPRSLDHVGVRDHVTVGVEDHSGAGGPLLDELAVGGRVARDQDLDHRRLDALAERLEVAAERGEVPRRGGGLGGRRCRKEGGEKEPAAVLHRRRRSPPLSGRCTA